MLLFVVRAPHAYAQVPDSDADELGVVVVLGKTVRAPTLALELSISQITGAARPALGCKVSPRLAQHGCELVVTLLREVRGSGPRKKQGQSLVLNVDNTGAGARFCCVLSGACGRGLLIVVAGGCTSRCQANGMLDRPPVLCVQ